MEYLKSIHQTIYYTEDNENCPLFILEDKEVLRELISLRKRKDSFNMKYYKTIFNYENQVEKYFERRKNL